MIWGLPNSVLFLSLVCHHNLASLVSYILMIVTIYVSRIQAILKYRFISHKKFSNFLAFWLLLKPFGSGTWILERVCELDKVSCINTTFLRTPLSFSKDWIMALKSSNMALTSAPNPTTLSSMNLSWDSNKSYYIAMFAIVCSTHKATVSLSRGHSPNNSSNQEVFSLKDFEALLRAILLLGSHINYHKHEFSMQCFVTMQCLGAL